MTNFRLVGFLDTFEIAGSLRQHMNLFKPVEGGEQVFPIRWDDGETWKRTKLWQKWVELRNAISRIQRQGSAMVGPLDLGRVFFEMVPAGVTLPWRTESGAYWETHMRVHYPVRTNPAAMMYSGIEMSHLMIGTLTLTNVTVPWCAVNQGEWPRVHLVVDLRRKIEEAGDG